MTATDRLTRLVASAGRVFVLSGAGMSTDSGVPDFRGPGGIWTRNPAAARLFDIEAYRSDPDVRRASWRFRLDSPIRRAAPNRAHLALAAWESAGRAVTIATQNIDGLHRRAGSGAVLELHGTFWRSVCLDCGDRRPIEETFARVLAGEDDPPCQLCTGILRTDTVAFGQSLDAAVLTAAVDAARSCDLALAIGSSLAVQPAASLCEVAASAGAPLVIVNAEPTAYDALAALVIRDRIADVLGEVRLRPPASPGSSATS